MAEVKINGQVIERFIHELNPDLTNYSHATANWLNNITSPPEMAVQQVRNEIIEQGAIATIEDVLNDPGVPEIWLSYINALSTILPARYPTQIMGNLAPALNVLPNLKFELTDQLSAPAAFSLVQLSNGRPNLSAPTFENSCLYINPNQLLGLVVGNANGEISYTDAIEDAIVTVLLHEVGHLTFGSCLLRPQIDSTDDERDQRLKLALVEVPARLGPFSMANQAEMINILDDLIINQQLIKSLQQYAFGQTISESMMQHSVTTVNDGVDNDRFAIECETNCQLTDSNLHYTVRQKAVLDYYENHRDQMKNRVQQKAGSLSDEAQATMGRIIAANQQVFNGLDEQAQNNIVDKQSSMVQSAKNLAEEEFQPAQEDTIGYSAQGGELCRRKTALDRAKTLPRLDFKLKNLVDGFIERPAVNWQRRSLMDPMRLDLAYIDHSGKHLAPKARLYLDASGSISAKTFDKICSVTLKTLKNYPHMVIRSFSTILDTEHLVDWPISTEQLQQIMDSLQTTGGTDITPVIDDIFQTPDDLHIVITDGQFGVGALQRLGRTLSNQGERALPAVVWVFTSVHGQYYEESINYLKTNLTPNTNRQPILQLNKFTLP